MAKLITNTRIFDPETNSGTKATLVLTDQATIAWNYSLSETAQVTLAGNRALTISNVSNATYGTLKVIQDGTGSRTLTLPSGSKVFGGRAGTITLTGTANAVDILSFYYDGTNYWWSAMFNVN